MSTMSSSFRKLIRQPIFLVTAAILLVAAVTLNTAVARLQLHFKKLPVPLAHDLDSLPAQMGDWVQVSKDEPLDHDTQDVLGTDKYIFRDYVNTKIIGAETLNQFKDLKTNRERKALLDKIEQQHAEGVINVALTYYTGLVDTVAHIPDRCYIADGYQPVDPQEPYWDMGVNPLPLGKTPQDDPRVQVRFITFEDQTGVAKQTKNVAYVFHVDGHYECSPIGVRIRLQDLTNKYGYYAKIELMTMLRDRDQSANVMIDFMKSARPEIERLLPDWNAVTKMQPGS